MTRRARIVLSVAAALLAALVIAAYLLVWPWLRYPGEPAPEILSRWAQVEQRAASFGAPGPESPRLVAAVDALRDWPELDDHLRTAPREELLAVRPGGTRALAELVAWAGENGGTGDDCIAAEPRSETGAQGVALYRLAQVAILAAARPDDPALVAALRLGAELRRHGAALTTVVGFKIAEEARATAVARKWAPAGALTELRPTVAELRTFPAREMACTFRIHEMLLTDRCERPNADGTIPWYHPLSEQRWCQRERLMFQWFYGRLFAAADAETDLARFAAALDLPDDNTLLPPSFLLQSNYCDPGQHVAALTDELAAYDAFVAGEG